MQLKNQKSLIGLLIILFGLLLLLNNFRLFDLDNQFWWGIAFFALGSVFLSIYRQDSTRKGPLVVGLIMLIIGFFTILDSFSFISDDLIAAILLWGLAAIFISIYLRHNKRWWAIIPGGALFILGLLVLFEELRILDNDYFGFIFLFGMSLVFWFLYLIRDDKNKLGWAHIVAIIFIIFSFFVLSEEFDYQITNILFPASIIICGGYLIIKGLFSDKK